MIRQPPSDWFDKPENMPSPAPIEGEKSPHYDASSKEITPTMFLRSIIKNFTYEFKGRLFEATLLENNSDFLAYLLKQNSELGGVYEIVYIYKRACFHQSYLMKALQACPDLPTQENWQIITTVPFLLRVNRGVGEDHWATHPFTRYFGFEAFAPIK